MPGLSRRFGRRLLATLGDIRGVFGPPECRVSAVVIGLLQLTVEALNGKSEKKDAIYWPILLHSCVRLAYGQTFTQSAI